MRGAGYRVSRAELSILSQLLQADEPLRLRGGRVPALDFQFFPSCFKKDGRDALQRLFELYLSILSQLLHTVFADPSLMPHLIGRHFQFFPSCLLFSSVPFSAPSTGGLSILSQLPHRRLHLGPGEDHPAALSILSQLPQRASELSSLPHLAR